MSVIDKFGRTLRDGGGRVGGFSGSSSGGGGHRAPIIEGLHLDSDRNYNARGKRIKSVAEPVHESDAVNLKRLREEIASLKTTLKNSFNYTIDKHYLDLTNLIADSLNNYDQQAKLRFALKDGAADSKTNSSGGAPQTSST